MKKTNKIIIALCIILTIIMIGVTSFAAGIKPSDFEGGTFNNTTNVTNFGRQIVAVVRTVGVLIAVVILLILGIKYMIGSAEEKADYKKSMIPYLVGAVLIFAASAVTGIVYDMASALGGPGGDPGTGG